jgi:DNA-binding NarL/FixJ family response regulator
MESTASGAGLRRNVLIVEDHELTRYGLVMALEERCGLCNVAECDNGKAAVDYVSGHPVDVILMDIGLPVMDGIAATKAIKANHPDTKVLMLTSHNDPEEVFASLAAGADAYCMKDIRVERLCQVIDMICEGALWLDPAIAQLVVQHLPESKGNDALGLDFILSSNSPSPAFETPSTDNRLGATEAFQNPGNGGPNGPHRRRYNAALTDREQQVLQLLVEGKSNKEIALALSVTLHTAKAHVGNIIQKLAVDDRTQVAIKALREGMVEPA